MILNTTSSVISFARQLETETAKFYEDGAEKYPEVKDVFLSFAKENSKAITQVERAYYNVITDAIEGCFAFELETDKYQIDTSITTNSELTKVLRKALDIEEKMIAFYTDSAEQSKSLMADVPRAFSLIAKKRNNRIKYLRDTLERGGLRAG